MATVDLDFLATGKLPLKQAITYVLGPAIREEKSGGDSIDEDDLIRRVTAMLSEPVEADKLRKAVLFAYDTYRDRHYTRFREHNLIHAKLDEPNSNDRIWNRIQVRFDLKAEGMMPGCWPYKIRIWEPLKRTVAFRMTDGTYGNDTQVWRGNQWVSVSQID